VSIEHRWLGAAVVGVAGILYTALVAAFIAFVVLDVGERLWFFEIARNASGKFRRARAAC
jgi:hypothetical protein